MNVENYFLHPSSVNNPKRFSTFLVFLYIFVTKKEKSYKTIVQELTQEQKLVKLK